MSGFDAEREAIETRFAVQWGNTTPVSYDNSAFTIPKNVPWMRLTILNGDGRNLDLESNVQYIGVISIQVFVPQDAGSKTSRTLADTASSIFSNQEFAGIECRPSSINRVGERDGWYQVNVDTAYNRR